VVDSKEVKVKSGMGLCCSRSVCRAEWDLWNGRRDGGDAVAPMLRPYELEAPVHVTQHHFQRFYSHGVQYTCNLSPYK
jgi:hypothetical protein